jgi:hypothetical protein
LVDHPSGQRYLSTVGQYLTKIQRLTSWRRHFSKKSSPIWSIREERCSAGSQCHLAVLTGDHAGGGVLHIRRKEIDSFRTRIDRSGIAHDAVGSTILKQVQTV